MSPLSILSIQIAFLMMSFKLTCAQALQAHSSRTMLSQNSAQRAAAAVLVADLLPPTCQPASQAACPLAFVGLARFLNYNASAEDIFKYTRTNAAFLCLSLTELAS